MIKDFEVGEAVSFLGNTDHESVDETVVAWVDNKMYQAIIEHPDGHSGGEIPGKGLEANKTYIFVKTDHLKELEDENADEITDVTAEKVEEAPASAEKASDTAEASSVSAGEKPAVVVSEQLQMFKENVSSSNHELIDLLIEKALEYERGDEALEQKPTIPTGKPEPNKTTAEIIDEHAEMAKEIGAEDRKKKTEDTISAIQELVIAGIEKGLIVVGKGTAVVNGNKDNEAIAAFYQGQPLCTLIDKDDTRSIAVYFYNVPDELAAFSVEVAKPSQKDAAAGGPEDEESGENPVTYKKKEEGSKKTDVDEDDDSEVGSLDEEFVDGAEEDTEEAKKQEEKESYSEKLVSLNGVGGATAKKIMEDYPEPKDLMAGYKKKSFKYGSRVNTALNSACKSGYFN